jgi:glycosyltransferase involved in cell wall biosynthesis
MKPICILLQNHYDLDIRVRRKAEALVSSGYPVEVFALRDSGGKKDYFLEGVHVRTASLGKARGSLARYMYEYGVFWIWAFINVAWRMPFRQYCVIDVNNLPDFLVFAAAVGKMLGAKVILDMHEITPEFYMSKYKMPESSWLVRFLKVIERWSMHFADRVITINEPITDLLVERGLNRAATTVIMNSADESVFHKNGKVAETKKTQGAFVMMYHGTLTQLYGLDIAIEAFAMAAKDMPGAEFWILGSGPEAKPLRELAEQRGLSQKVKLIGRVPIEQIPSWLDQADIGILPIRRDVFLEFASPNKLPEYIIMGKAVVISRLKAIRRCFDESSLAFFEPENVADLAQQMLRLYRSPETRKSLSASAAKDYASIRWEIMKARYLNLVGSLIPANTKTDESSQRTIGVA